MEKVQQQNVSITICTFVIDYKKLMPEIKNFYHLFTIQVNC